MSPLDFTDQSRSLIAAAVRLYERNLLAAGDGNLSLKLEADLILMTPTGRSKSQLRPEELALVRPDGEVLAGKPSSEKLMHLKVFESCPAAKAVVHAHPPWAISWSIARPEMKELPSESLSELILSCGEIPVVPYARPGTKAMGEVLKDYLPQRRVMILARHGGLSWGESLEEAVGGIERLEHTAQILGQAESLGGLTSLDPEEVAHLRAMRAQLGERTL